MSSNRPDHDPDSLANARSDAAIRERLANTGTQPSKAHDKAILEAARAFTDSGEDDTHKVHAAKSSSWPLAVAAAAVLAIGVALVTDSGPDQPPDVLRGESSATLPVTGAVLTNPPNTFRWPDAGAGRSYRLVIRDSSGNLVHSGAWQASNQFAVDQQLERQLSETGDYLWVVEQRGQADQSLGPFRFQISETSGSE